MSATVLLIRHALHDGGADRLCGRRPDIALSDSGKRDAEALGRRLARHPVRAIETSPLLRTEQTARHLARASGCEVEIAPALAEIDFGEWDGMSFAELDRDPRWRAWNSRRSEARAPEGESMVEAQDRAVRHVDAVARDHDRGIVALVSHGDIIRAVVAHYLGLSLDYLLRFDVDPASVTTLDVNGEGGRVVRLNEAPA